jgi:hypothetical protein
MSHRWHSHRLVIHMEPTATATLTARQRDQCALQRVHSDVAGVTAMYALPSSGCRCVSDRRTRMHALAAPTPCTPMIRRTQAHSPTRSRTHDLTIPIVPTHLPSDATPAASKMTALVLRCTHQGHQPHSAPTHISGTFKAIHRYAGVTISKHTLTITRAHAARRCACECSPDRTR